MQIIFAARSRRPGTTIVHAITIRPHPVIKTDAGGARWRPSMWLYFKSVCGTGVFPSEQPITCRRCIQRIDKR